jgi:hypothetical protein
MLEEGVANLVPAIDPECEASASRHLRLIMRRVRQGAFVLEDLAEIAAIEPAAAGRAPDKMLGITLRRIAQALAAGMPVTFPNPLRPPASPQARQGS